MRKITPQEQEAGFRLNLGEYFRVLWRKKYFLVVPLVISLAVANVGSRFLVPEYESTSLIRIGNTNVGSDLDRYVQNDISRKTRDAEVAAKLQADVLGNAFLDKLIRDLGMDQDPDLIAAANRQREALYTGVSTEELVLRRLRTFLKTRIKIALEGPGLYRFSYADADPEACYVVTNTMTRLYMDTQRIQVRTGLKEVSDFSEEQLGIYKERLDRSERALAEFQEQVATRSTVTNPVGNFNVATAERLRTDLNLTISSAEATLTKIRARVVSVTGVVPNDARVWNDPEVRKLENDLASRRESELLAELNTLGGSPMMGTPSDAIIVSQQSLQRRIGQLVLERFADIPADFQPLVVEYFYQQAEVRAFQHKRSRLEAHMGSFRSSVAYAPQMDTRLSQLRQEVESNREIYDQFKGMQTTTQIKERVLDTDLGTTVFLIEAATRPLAPVRPDRVKILILAVMFGIALGAAGLLLTEFTDSSFRSVDDVEKLLGLKVLGTIPRFERARWFHDSTRRKAVLWAATSALFLVVALSAFYFYGKSTREQMIDLNFTTSEASPPRNTP